MTVEEKAIKELKSPLAFSLSAETREVAIKYIGKAIAKKPVEKNELGAMVVLCPNCKNYLFDSDSSDSTNRRTHREVCIYCGQKLTKTGKYLGHWESE